MAAFNASQLKLFVVESATDVLISKQTSTNFDLETADIDITSKDTEGWAESIPGLKSGTLSLGARIDYETTTGQKNFEDVFGMWDGRTIYTWKLKGTIGSKTVTMGFDGWVKKISNKLDMETAADCALDIKVTGNVTMTVA